MNSIPDGLPQRYADALKQYLRQRPGGNLGAARRMGEQAVEFAVTTRELARIHRRALAGLKLLGWKAGTSRLADIFLAVARIAVEKSDPAIRRGRQEPFARIEEQSPGDPLPQRRVAKSRVIEIAFENGRNDDGQVLVESLELQRHLRRETHRSMLAQEADRLKTSHDLQDEIGQTLLGINVQLLSLKQSARKNPKGLKGEITLTQRLVAKSASSVRQMARELARALPRSSRPVSNWTSGSTLPATPKAGP